MSYSEIVSMCFCRPAEPRIEMVPLAESSEASFPLIIPSNPTADLCIPHFLVATASVYPCKQTGTIIQSTAR